MQYQKTGFKSITKLIEKLVKNNARGTIVSLKSLKNIWTQLVGDDIANKAKPYKIKSLQNGNANILYLGMSGPFMAELSLQKQDIMDRVNAYYSKEIISEIRIELNPIVEDDKMYELTRSQNFETMKSGRLEDLKIRDDKLEEALFELKIHIERMRKGKVNDL